MGYGQQSWLAEALQAAHAAGLRPRELRAVIWQVLEMDHSRWHLGQKHLDVGLVRGKVQDIVKAKIQGKSGVTESAKRVDFADGSSRDKEFSAGRGRRGGRALGFNTIDNVKAKIHGKSCVTEPAIKSGIGDGSIQDRKVTVVHEHGGNALEGNTTDNLKAKIHGKSCVTEPDIKSGIGDGSIQDRNVTVVHEHGGNALISDTISKGAGFQEARCIMANIEGAVAQAFQAGEQDTEALELMVRAFWDCTSAAERAGLEEAIVDWKSRLKKLGLP